MGYSYPEIVDVSPFGNVLSFTELFCRLQVNADDRCPEKEYKARTQYQEWACIEFCRIGLDDHSLQNFFGSLCRTKEELDEVVRYDPVEICWTWDAPRQRMAKLLWQLLHQVASEEEFFRRFTLGKTWESQECLNAAAVLAPIQERLKWVMEGLLNRQKQDDHIGQSNWGERCWLPPEQTEFVNEQLKQMHPELIEHYSAYEDSVRMSLEHYINLIVQALPVPCTDPGRVYFGERHGPDRRTFVWVVDTKGNKYPLKRCENRWLGFDDMTGFDWGYGGSPSNPLGKCILVDALDGDWALAHHLDHDEWPDNVSPRILDLTDTPPSSLLHGFSENLILDCPRDKDLTISRATVLEWVKEVGKFAVYEKRRKSIAKRIAASAKEIAKREDLIRGLEKTSDLLSQRFDIVPDTFESALYLDLMCMLEQGGAALRCSHCGLPIPYDRSGRANKQRARSKDGHPIYHPDCFAEHGRERKKVYWQSRARSSKFRASERKRAQEYRKLSSNDEPRVLESMSQKQKLFLWNSKQQAQPGPETRRLPKRNSPSGQEY
jgi:hypothetical protein